MVALQEIKAEATGFRELLKQFSGFSIPSLQRPYAWEENNVQDFIDDTVVLLKFLQEHRNKEIGEHLFGTVVTIGQHGLEQQIVDGQQRMTTVTLALALLMSAYDRLLGKPNLVEEIRSDCVIARRELENILFRGDDKKATRLTPSPSIAKTYRDILSGGSGTKDGEKLPAAARLRNARTLILAGLIDNEDLIAQGIDKSGRAVNPQGGKPMVEPLDEYRHYNDLQTVLLERLKLVHVRTSSADASYDLFESLNTRGADLNVLDLVKVWMLARFAGSTDEVELSAAWDQLGDVDETVQISYLEDFFKARAYRSPNKTDRGGKSSALEFSRSVRRSLFKEGAIGAATGVIEQNKLILSEVELMASWKQSWAALKTFESEKSPRHPYGNAPESRQSEKSHEILLRRLLQTLKNSASIPVLLQGSNRLTREEFDILVGLLIRYFFRFMTLGRGSVDRVATVYGECCASINDSRGKSLKLIASKLDSEALNQLSDSDFQFSWSNQKMTPTKAALWLQLVEFFTPGRKPFLFDEGAVAIQMLAPSGAETEDELRLINSVGNFILVPRSVRVTSGSFAELKKLLPSRAEMVIYPTSVSAFKYASWDLATISARNDEISKLAAKAFRTSM
jgi:Protein of unknown function DUF262